MLKQSPKRLQPWLMLGVAVWLITSITGLNADSGDDYKKSIEEIGSKIDKISKNLNANRALLKTEQGKLSVVEQKISNMDREIASTKNQILLLERSYTDLATTIEKLNKGLVNDKESLSKLVRQRYTNGQPNYLKMLLNQENPYAVGRLSNYYNYFAKAQQQKLEQIRRQIDKSEQLKQSKQEKTRVLELEQEKLAVQQESLGKAKAERKQTIQKLSSKVSKTSDQLKRLKQDRSRLNTLLEQIAEQAAALKKLEQERLAEQKRQAVEGQPPRQQTEVIRPLVKGGFIKQRGRLKYPVSATPSIRFGSRLAESGMKSQGVHFKTQKSAQVKAIFRGRVLFADYLKGYGLLLIIDHGDDHISLYGHNDVLYKNVGDMVETGEAMANTGTTGGLKAPGLYFEIRKSATPVDPSNWCR